MESRALERFCVFCGQKPVEKTNEHVVPRWLIALTGDPKRQLTVGPLLSSHVLDEEESVYRKFSFDSLRFPACGECNQRFSELEAKAKPIMAAILSSGPLSAGDFDLLLDWFDKVRVGLWLGYHLYLDKNVWGIDPHFHIEKRIGAADRALLIYRAAGDIQGLGLGGVNTPAFAHTPSCFTLIVNGVFLQNVSHHFLLSKQMGLPHPSRMELTDDENLRSELAPGTETLRLPVFDFRYEESCTVVAQPVFSRSLSSTGDAEVSELYDRDYVKNMTLRSNRGVPLLCKRGDASLCPLEPSSEWVVDRSHDLRRLQVRNAIQTLWIQNHVTKLATVSGDVPEERKQMMEFEFSQCVNANDRLISRIVHERVLQPQIGAKVPRNAPCPCESGKKYKFCCGRRDLHKP